MKTTLQMPPHERLALLRKGDKVLCKKCKVGIMEPIGDHKITNTFICHKCSSQIIVD